MIATSRSYSKPKGDTPSRNCDEQEDNADQWSETEQDWAKATPFGFTQAFFILGITGITLNRQPPLLLSVFVPTLLNVDTRAKIEDLSCCRVIWRCRQKI
jgi:hypothetical protein